MNVLYYFLKIYCTVALQVYFRRWQVAGRQHIPDGPVIFVANHQNAFLDAVLVACSSARNPWSITRASVFEKPWAARVLGWLHMLPVYRFRDGFHTLRNNQQTLAQSSALLHRGEAILIFAEGNHDSPYRLRPLQKGFARMALAALEGLPPGQQVHIVPVGIQYDSLHHFRSRVLIQFGAPRAVHAADTLDVLVEDLTRRLTPLMLHIPETSDYADRIQYLRQHRVWQQDLQQQLASDRETLRRYAPTTGFFSDKAHHAPWWNPIFLYGFLNHAAAWLILRWMMRTKMKDPQFTGSLKFAVGMFLTPITYVVQIGVGYFAGVSWPMMMLYGVTLLPAGLAAYHFVVPRHTR